MICPYCGKRTPDGSEYCAVCGYPLDQKPEESAQTGSFDAALWQARTISALRGTIIVLLWIISLTILGYGAYKGYYWRQSVENTELFDSGMLPAPMLEAIELADGRQGHVVTFFGDDGDMIYIEELKRSYLVVGGEARVEIADSYWFETAPEEVQSADIALTPIQTFVGGGKQLLPVVRRTGTRAVGGISD